MTAETLVIIKPEKPAGANLLRVLLGLLLFFLPAVFCISYLLLPTLSTFYLSLQNIRLLTNAAQFVGTQNYLHLFADPVFRSAVDFTVLIVLVRLLVVAILPPLLGYAAGRLGRTIRMILRVVFTLPMILYIPVSIGVMWRLVLSPASQIIRIPTLSDPAAARPVLLLIDSLYTLGLACGVGLIFFAAASRGDESGQSSPIKPMIAAWLVGLLATIALSVQDFSLSFTLTQGGPRSTTTTLAFLEYIQTFRNLNIGTGAAIASLLIIVLAICGLIAGLVMVFSGLRLSLAPRAGLVSMENSPSSSKVLPLVLLILSLLFILPICTLGLLPILWTGRMAMRPMVGEALLYSFPTNQILTNTFLPLLLLVFLIQLPIAYLGALGISALRPLGRWSELLLLPFTPWLFVTMIPLSVRYFLRMRGIGAINQLASLAPPLVLNVAMLVILALFFKGQEAAWQEARAAGETGAKAFFGKLILPSIPLALFLGAAALFAGAMSAFWPLVTISDQRLYPVSLVLIWLQNQYAMDARLLTILIARLLLPVTTVFFLIFALFQIFFLDKLSLHNR